MSMFSSEIAVTIRALEYDSTPLVEVLGVALYGGVYWNFDPPSGGGPVPYTVAHWKGRIKSDVILDKRIGSQFWSESSVLDFGYIDIAIEDQDAEILDFVQKVTQASVVFDRVQIRGGVAGPGKRLSESRSSDIAFVNENTVRFRLESSLQGAFDSPINEKYFDDDLPLVGGKPWPIAWMYAPSGGPEQLIPAVLYDPTTLNYAINDTLLFIVDGVYDKGVKLLAPSQYTVTTNGVELKQNPEGRVTVSGLLVNEPGTPIFPPVSFARIDRYTRAGMTRAGIFANAEYAEITALHAELNMGLSFPQFFTQKVVSLKQFLDSIYSATGIWYYTDESSRVHFGRLRSPDNEKPDYAFDDSNVIGDIRVEDDKAPGLSASISHGESPGAYTEDELAGSVTSADRFAMINKSIETRTTKPIIPFYSKAESREPIPLALPYFESGTAQGRSSVNRAGPYATFETKPAFTDAARVTSSYDTSAGIFNPTALKMVSNDPTEGIVYLSSGTSYPLTLPANQKWVVSIYVRIDPASSPRSTLNFRMFLETAAGFGTSGFVTVTPDNQYHRISFVADFTAISETQCRVRLDNRAYDAADATMYVDGLQIELDDGSGQPTPFSDPVPSSTDLARTEVNRWFEELYPKRRRFYSFDVAINDPLFEEIPLRNRAGNYATFETKPVYGSVTRANVSYSSVSWQGDVSLKIESTSAGGSFCTTGVSSSDYPLFIPAFRKFVLSCYVRLDPTGSPKATNNVQFDIRDETGAYYSSPLGTVVPNGTFQRVSFAIDMTSSGATKANIRLVNLAHDGSSTTMYFDGLQLEVDDGSGLPSPFQDPDAPRAPPELGQHCSLQSGTFRALETPKNLLIRRVKYNYSRNIITLEGWG